MTDYGQQAVYKYGPGYSEPAVSSRNLRPIQDGRGKGHSTGMDSAGLMRQLALQQQQWIDASHPMPLVMGGGGGGAGGGGGGAAAAPAAKPLDPFEAAIQHVNQMYDQQHAHLDQLTGNAKAGVNQVGSDVMARLTALGKDAKGANAKTDKSIADTYHSAQSNQSAEYGQLLADLQRQGAGTQTLGAEERARQGALSSASARQSSTSDRYSQLLDQSLNGRDALAKQTTGNSLNDLTRAFQSADFAAQQQKANAIYQIQQQKAQHDAAMAAAAAASRGRGGGGGGGGSSKGLSAASAISLIRLLGKGGKAGTKGADVQALLKSSGLGDFMDKGNVSSVANGYINDIMSGKITPQYAITNAQSRGFGNNEDSYGGGNWGDGAGVDLMNMLYGIGRGGGRGTPAQPGMGADQTMALFQLLYGA